MGDDPGSGPTSPTSDRVRAVHRLANRSFRHKVGQFLVEGPQAVGEAITHRPDAVVDVFVVPGSGDAVDDVRRQAGGTGLRVTEVDERVLLAMTETVHPQGIAAVCRFLHRELGDILRHARLVAVLHDVRDPGNAGTILRTADAAGADAVLFTGDSVDPYNGKCVRSTAGSLFHVPLAIEPSLAEVLTHCRARGLSVVATTRAAAASLTDPEVATLLGRPLAWVFGNEAQGLPRPLLDATDHQVAIPVYGAAESLNLAAAAAVCLYASAFAQHGHPG